MAGQPITRQYLARIEQIGIKSILDRIAEGESIAAVARGIGTSRQFLSTFLNSTSEGTECLALAREVAAASGPKSKGSGTHSEVYGWTQNSIRPHLNDWMAARLSLAHTGRGGAERSQADHLAALRELRSERIAAPQNRATPPEPQGLPYSLGSFLTTEVTP